MFIFSFNAQNCVLDFYGTCTYKDGRKIVKATENENIKCRNKVKSHMTFAFYGKAETSECTFKTFDLLFHTP